MEAESPEPRRVHPVQRGRRAAVVPRPLRLPARARRHRPVPAAQRQRLLIMRDLFVNEEVYHWSDVCDHETAALLHARGGDRPGEAWASTRSASTTSRPPSPGRRTTSRTSRRRGLRPREVEHADGRGLPGADWTDSASTWRRSRRRRSSCTTKTAADVPAPADHQRHVRLLHRHDPAAPAAGRHRTTRLHANSTSGRSTSACRNYYYDITKRGFAQVDGAAEDLLRRGLPAVSGEKRRPAALEVQPL